MIACQSSSLPVGQRGERVTRRAATSAASEGPRLGGVDPRGAAAPLRMAAGGWLLDRAVPPNRHHRAPPNHVHIAPPLTRRNRTGMFGIACLSRCVSYAQEHLLA